MHFTRLSSAALLAALPSAFAQTFTDCNPTEKTCPNDTGLNAGSFLADFTKGESAIASWSSAKGTTLQYSNVGAQFQIAKNGQAPTIQTDFYIIFGRVDVKMRAAPGAGIVSSIVLQSDDLDEIDWEWLGGNNAQVETNFFGKGNTTNYDRATYYPVSTPTDSFHTYTIDWTKDSITWMIDGTTVRTLPYSDPSANGGHNFPQSPMRLKLGNWAAGGEGQPKGTVQWSGGPTDFGKGPFNMFVQSVAITNYNPADNYEFTDRSGSWQSIKINGVSSSGGSSSGSGSGSATSTTTGGNTASGMTTSVGSTKVSNITVTTAPTSNASVVGIDQNTGAAVLTTSTGASYSINTASVSAQNTVTSIVIATGAGETGGASPTGSDSNGTYSGTASASQPSQTGGASSLSVVAAGSLLSIGLGFWLW